jgi:hypothetical protein
LYKTVVFPAASRPIIKILMSFVPKLSNNEKKLPMLCLSNVCLFPFLFENF